MNLKILRCLTVALYGLLCERICAVNSDLNYTGSQTGFISANRVFKLNESARGFIRFNAGFTVKPDARVSLDVPIPIQGPLDLRETGTVRLISDLIFDSSVTLSAGGRIDGNNHRIKLNNNFTIPAGKVLHINGNTTIDGNGFNVVCNEHSQIFVDTNVTLTLCNMTITNKQHTPTFPPVLCGAQTSKLALNNVVVRPTGDFLFPQGQLFVHNDVMMTGTSAFIYASPMPSFITAGSCLYFDQGTTFSVAPSTFTDAAYTLKNTYTSSNFLQFADASSSLYFNGCSLYSTPTGCRFTKGNIFLDNHVICKSDTTVTMTSVTLRASQSFGSGGIFDLSWSPDGKYLAVGGSAPSTSGNLVQVYQFDGFTLSLISGAQVVYGASGAVYAVAWSPDGKYLAIGGIGPTSGNELQIYSFNGSSLTAVSGAQIDYGSLVRSICWNKDGKYLAIGGSGPTSGMELKVYSFDGSSLKLAASPVASPGSVVQGVSWSPDGLYVIVSAYNTTNEVQTYSFNGSSLTLGAQIDYGVLGSFVDTAVLSPDGRYLAIGGGASSNNNALQIWRFTGAALTLVPGAQIPYATTGRVWMNDWSPDGRYVATAVDANGFKVYNFDKVSLSLISQVNPAAYTGSIRWRPDGRFLAIGTATPSVGHKEIEVYRADFVTNTSPQAYSKGIVFGDSRYGVSSDAMVTLLADARVDLTGKMSDDNFSG